MRCGMILPQILSSYNEGDEWLMLRRSFSLFLRFIFFVFFRNRCNTYKIFSEHRTVRKEYPPQLQR